MYSNDSTIQRIRVQMDYENYRLRHAKHLEDRTETSIRELRIRVLEEQFAWAVVQQGKKQNKEFLASWH